MEKEGDEDLGDARDDEEHGVVELWHAFDVEQVVVLELLEARDDSPWEELEEEHVGDDGALDGGSHLGERAFQSAQTHLKLHFLFFEVISTNKNREANARVQ